VVRPRLILSCEHARAALPEGLDLGLEAAALASHIAWDEGALELALDLARRTGAPLFEGEHSRLLVDLNRREEDPGVIPERAFGVLVPGNRGLSAQEREARLARYHRPYRARIVQAVELRDPCLHLSLHSFTPTLHGQVRTVQVGVLYDPARAEEQRWADRLREALRAASLDARFNEPYLGTDEGLTTWLRERFPDPRYAGLELELHPAVDRALGARICAAVLPSSPWSPP